MSSCRKVLRKQAGGEYVKKKVWFSSTTCCDNLIDSVVSMEAGGQPLFLRNVLESMELVAMVRTELVDCRPGGAGGGGRHSCLVFTTASLLVSLLFLSLVDASSLYGA